MPKRPQPHPTNRGAPPIGPKPEAAGAAPEAAGAAPAAAAVPAVHALAPGQLLLIYSPDGPLGGTFTCPVCRAQAWQPDLLVHALGCPHHAPLPGGSTGAPVTGQ